jgi:hypothetical protein
MAWDEGISILLRFQPTNSEVNFDRLPDCTHTDRLGPEATLSDVRN